MIIADTEIMPAAQMCSACNSRPAVVLHQGEDLRKRPEPLCESCISPMSARLRKFLRKFADK